MPITSLNRLVRCGKAKLEKTQRKWRACTGPGTTLIMTCRRIGWEVVDAEVLETDEGRRLHMGRDPPAVVRKEVVRAVQKWRWKRIEVTHPQLARNGSGRGALMEPIWKLLKQPKKGKQAKLSPQEQGCLKSVAAGRQYTQSRVRACGWAEHDKCLVCLLEIVEADKARCGGAPDVQTQVAAGLECTECGVSDGTSGGSTMTAAAETKKETHRKVEASQSQIDRAPVGNLNHR